MPLSLILSPMEPVLLLPLPQYIYYFIVYISYFFRPLEYILYFWYQLFCFDIIPKNNSLNRRTLWMCVCVSLILSTKVTSLVKRQICVGFYSRIFRVYVSKKKNFHNNPVPSPNWNTNIDIMGRVTDCVSSTIRTKKKKIHRLYEWSLR